jgi:hypothetical protein
MMSRRDKRARRIAAGGLFGALLLSACAPVPTVEEPVAEPRPPARSLADASHYRVVDERTLVYARVFRGGTMARLGHNHVVLFRDVDGDIHLADEPAGSLFDLFIPLAGAVVDPPGLRRAQGREFRTDISDDARARTRDNMLSGDLLDAARYPYIVIRSSAIEGPFAAPTVELDITIRGVTRRFTLPVSLVRDDDGLVAKGRLELLQSEFGIEPFQVLGGALRVKDRVELTFEVAARRVD